MQTRFILQYLFGILIIGWLVVSGSWWDEYHPNAAHAIRAVAFIFLIIGVIGRLYATIFIGGMKNEGVDGKKFIDYGAYSLCRNPLYFFSFLAFIGLLLLTAQLVLTAVGVVFFLAVYHFTILGEEAFLRGRFGRKAFDKFTQSTSRFFPNFRNFRCPKKIEVRPQFLHKELVRSLNWFLSAAGFIIVAILHKCEILPNLIFMF